MELILCARRSTSITRRCSTSSPPRDGVFYISRAQLRCAVLSIAFIGELGRLVRLTVHIGSGRFLGSARQRLPTHLAGRLALRSLGSFVWNRAIVSLLA